ncbi:hypothetical protein BV921_15130 [Pectobacterium odoriferum]|uniref:hypothetical protein n=1 Tax=Pectobacterium odoriferum TaxID=78398 RepID=UPI000CD12F8D|nr:hypothetical protein [Pectobacterium odoriferum]POE08560.1 hypothetical protein BV921_15130 [Pectobacterium odoriferum]
MEEKISIEQNSGSGAYSLAGYDYQIDVSIWLALDLMLGSGLTQMIELEPGSEEDLEAQLADDEPGRVATCVGLDGYTLVVQVKLRSGDAWTVSGINRLLKYGSSTRISAARRLTNPAVRYLLVTSAVLNGKARTLRVKHAGSWPKHNNELPISTAKLISTNAIGRIAVIDNLDEDRLVQEIKRLLIERFGVPNSRWIECLQALRCEAKLRIRGAGGGRWCREELVPIIRNHDGYMASSPQLDNYVHPRNWQELRNAMGVPNYAALIVGQSGTGKTLATSKIYEELRRENPGLTRVPIRYGPQQLRDDRTPRPVLYDIEDPWGRYDFDPASRPWNDELAKLMSLARADSMIIATSRLDVAVASGALKFVEQWIVPLEAEQYGKPERQKLYRTRIDALPRDVHLLASAAEKQVLDNLATPLEIEKFFDALRMAERSNKKNEKKFISDAIAKAHEQSIEQTVIQQIEQRKDLCAAAIIWAFLKANDRLSLPMLRSLELELVECIPAMVNGVTPLIDFFIAARNLRSGAGHVSYYHPRVEAGIEGALKRHAVQAKIALRAFLEVLTNSDGVEVKWGAGVAARVISAAKRIPELGFTPKKTTATQVDIWLSNRLADLSCSLSEHVSLAAEAGSPDSNIAEFARYLLHRPEKGFGGSHFWGEPGHPESWYERLRADPQIALIACRFIREVLPKDRVHYGKEFVDDLDRLATGLIPAYLDAATAIVRHGYISSSEEIAKGALRDLERFESILDRAVEKLILSKEERNKADETRLDIINDVYNSDYAEHLLEDDDGYTAYEFLEAYADRVREIKGWMSLAQHRHAERLLRYWMRSLMNNAKINPISQDEMIGAFTAAFDSEEESALWFVLMKHWDKSYLSQLISRVRDGSPWSDVRQSALVCLIEQVPNFLTLIIDELCQVGRNERIVELMIDLAYLQNRRQGEEEKHAIAATAVMNHLSPELQELCKVAYSSAEGKLPPLSEAVKNQLGNLVCSLPGVRMLRIIRHLDLPDSVRVDIEWILANSDERDDCIKALEAAIALGFHDIVVSALEHRFSHVVAKALEVVGESAPTPLPADLLALANAKGSPVRKSLVRLLSTKPHLNHLPALLQLVEDQWSSFSRHYSEDDSFPIARSAVDAISKLGPLDVKILEQLQRVALDTSDSMVRTDLFKIIAVQGGHAFQQQLFELAVTPGRSYVRRSAAHAMLASVDFLDVIVIDEITADLLITRTPQIAVVLTLIVACRASSSKILEVARELSANVKRRGLLLLMLWPKVELSISSKLAIEKLLPEDHPSLGWVNAGPSKHVKDTFIADLGDPAICREILQWLNPKEEKS